jgi:hypothetical protein
MSKAQNYISTLLERLPKWELTSYEHQTSLDKLRDRISSASDLHQELDELYCVKGFSDFALSLMWIVDKVEKGSTLEESTLAEETLVFSYFRQAVGGAPPPAREPAPASVPFGTPPSFGSSQPAAPVPEMDSIWGMAAQAAQAASLSPAQEQERNFSSLLERFLEAVQSGNDNKTTLMSEVFNECSRILDGNPVSQDYQTFSQLLVDFLQYVKDNQYLDDVRVMNVLSNIQDPFAQWVRSEPQNRTGILDQAINILRDFKAMFE